MMGTSQDRPVGVAGGRVSDTSTAKSVTRVLVGAWPWLLALAVTAPLLAPGFVLSYDMVFVPRQSLVPEALGLGGPLPRAVPVDAVLAVLTQVVPGSLLQKAVLVLVLGLAGWGASLLVPGGSAVARLAAATWYVWNPFVAERLVLGHWTLLVGYASLPWLVRAAIDLRNERPGAQLRVVALLVPSALSAGPAVIALLTVVPVLAYRPTARLTRRLGLTAAAWVVLNAPWWLPALLHPTTGRSPDDGVAAFAARAEGPVGTLGSVLGLGGVWNADVVPDSRGLVTAALFLVVLLAVSALGLRPVVSGLGGGGAGLVVAAGVGLVLALIGSVAPLQEALGWAVMSLPGAGLVRDGQKFLAPFALAQALAFALGCVAVGRYLGAGAVRVVPAVLLLLPLAVLPDLAWGVGGRLQPVDYPDDWSVVRQLVADEPDSGDVVALPWQSFRRFDWNDDRVVLDPAPRWLTTTVVVDDTLTVAGRTVAGEDPRAAEVGSVLRAGLPLVEALPPLGIGWVLVERRTPGSLDRESLSGATTVFSGADLELVRLGPTTSPDLPPWAPAVVVADLLAVMVALGATAGAVASRLLGRARALPGRW